MKNVEGARRRHLLESGAHGEERPALVAVRGRQHVGHWRPRHDGLEQLHNLGLYGGIRILAERRLDEDEARAVEVDGGAEGHAHDTLWGKVPRCADHAVAVRSTRAAERVPGAEVRVAEASQADQAVVLMGVDVGLMSR